MYQGFPSPPRSWSLPAASAERSAGGTQELSSPFPSVRFILQKDTEGRGRAGRAYKGIPFGGLGGKQVRSVSSWKGQLGSLQAALVIVVPGDSLGCKASSKKSGEEQMPQSPGSWGGQGPQEVIRASSLPLGRGGIITHLILEVR